jgi:hypothetical protein
MSEPLTKTQLCTLAVVQFFRENPDRWCKEYAARRADGPPCDPEEREAVVFCFMGAWQRLGFDLALIPRGFSPETHNDHAANLDEMLLSAQRAARLSTPVL